MNNTRIPCHCGGMAEVIPVSIPGAGVTYYKVTCPICTLTTKLNVLPDEARERWQEKMAEIKARKARLE